MKDLFHSAITILHDILNQLATFIPTGGRSDNLTRYPGFTRHSSQEKVPFEQIGHLT
jgi:hypothetical protein